MSNEIKDLYEFGPFRLDATRRLVTREKQVLPLTSKVFDTLLVLVRNRDRVLVKDELMKMLWPDSFVEEVNLAQNVSALRKLLGETPGQNLYIATIPGVGYRFVGEVRNMADQDELVVHRRTLSKVLIQEGEDAAEIGTTTGTEITAAPSRVALPSSALEKRRLIEDSPFRRHPMWAVLGILAVVAVIAAVAIRQRLSSAPPSRQPTLLRLTFDEGPEGEPSWSPDGRFIAYSSERGGNFEIWVQPVGGGTPIPVTKSPAQDWQPDWSPDGQNIVFRSERDGGGLYIVPALGGNERKISSFGFRPRWSPDGSQILFYGSMIGPTVDAPKIYVAGLDGNPPHEVLSEVLNQFTAFLTGLSVSWHPDGRRISILGNHRKLGLSFWTVPLTGGIPVQSDLAPEIQQRIKDADVAFSGFAWAPSGRALYLEGNCKGVKNLWQVGVDPQTLRWVHGPERLTTGAGADSDVTVSRDGNRVAFTERSQRTRAWSLPFDAKTGRINGAGQPVTSADRDAWMPALSPDGKKLAFIAQHSGKQEFWDQSLQEVWVKSLVNGSETFIAGGDGFSRNRPNWSRDGQQLAYARFRSVNPEHTRLDFSIVIVPAVGGEEKELFSALGPMGDVALDWSPDGASILENSETLTPGRFLIGLLPIAAAPHADASRKVITGSPNYNLWQAQFSPDGRWVAFCAVDAPGGSLARVYVVPASGGSWVQISDGKYWEDKPRWSPDGRTIYFVSNRTGFYNVWGIRFDRTNGKPTGDPFRVTSFQSPSQMISPVLASMEMSVTTDRIVLDISQVSGNIWMLDNIARH